MIKFLLKGIIKDKSRSLLPVIVVTLGVMITVFLECWITGIMGESIELNANITTGHLKIMTRAYREAEEQNPLDLALTGADTLLRMLKRDYGGETDWAMRIRFGGLIDIPDSAGETRGQGPAAGWAIDILGRDSKERERFNLEKALRDGSIPKERGEGLISEEFAKRYKVKTGDTFTLFSTTMDGSMSFRNFRVAGTVRFGSPALDRGAVIIDIRDAQEAFGMEGATAEILGFFGKGYEDERARETAEEFNVKYSKEEDEYSPVMVSMRDQGGMGSFLDYANMMSGIMIFVFVMAMSVVLWNAGLLGGLRRYTEFGIRLALGEEKKQIYRSLIYEAILIGIIGSVTGTILGLGISYYMQEVGLDMSGWMENSSLLMPAVARAVITPTAYFIGFIPGVFSMVAGNALSGIGIYKRRTATLFKELET